MQSNNLQKFVLIHFCNEGVFFGTTKWARRTEKIPKEQLIAFEKKNHPLKKYMFEKDGNGYVTIHSTNTKFFFLP